MEEAKHTPAPWWVDDFGGGDVRVVVDPDKGAPPPICDARTFVCKMYQEDKRGIDAKANARLISAAPDLLEALQATQIDLRIMRGNVFSAAKTENRWDGMVSLIDEWITRNNEAIAKALGK